MPLCAARLSKCQAGDFLRPPHVTTPKRKRLFGGNETIFLAKRNILRGKRNILPRKSNKYLGPNGSVAAETSHHLFLAYLYAFSDISLHILILFNKSSK